MSNEIRVTIPGRLTAAPELRFLDSGVAVASFTVASNARKFDRQANEWKDEPPTFLRCTAWRELAQNVTDSLDKGDAVIVTGNLVQRSWEDRETGTKRSAIELQAEDVGPSLRWASAKVTRTQRGDSTSQVQRSGAQAADPWATDGGSQEPPW